MCKLFLTSTGIPAPDLLGDLFKKSASQVAVAVIPNAKDHYPEEIRNQKASLFMSQLLDLGYQSMVVDLNAIKHGQLLEVLKKFDAVWVMGGNTFYLRKAMHDSGFDTIIGGLVDDGMVYCGESAGAVVAGLSLEAVDAVDDDTVRNKITEGLKLAPFYFLPHADNTLYEKGIARIRNSVMGKYTVVQIAEQETVTIKNGKVTRTNSSVYKTDR